MQCKKRLHGGFVCLFGFFRGRWVHVEIPMLNVFINLIIDLIYGLADPRIRLD